MNLEQLRQFIQSDLLTDPQTQITNDQDLLLSGMLDSLNVMRLVAFIEKGLSITIPPEDIVLEHFSSISDMTKYLESRDICIGD